jgi:hypothetical protein
MVNPLTPLSRLSNLSLAATSSAVVELDAASFNPVQSAQLTISEWFERVRRGMEAESQTKVKLW